MRILILEDNKERIKIFRTHLGPKHELYFFDQVEEAKKALLSMGTFDRIYLDHDLDGRVFVDSDESNTGYQLAKYIALQKVNAEIIIHTLNPWGAARMKKVLPKSKRVVFDELFDIW
ncbi:MAG: hypothetical protein KAS61_05015 [Spirochaetes bacterium]|nr:hypothetical protein [Spirochaetota bacterium]